jgi:hypothetical protein
VVPERSRRSRDVASTAGWCWSGERDEEEYTRNQRCYVSDCDTCSNLAYMGRIRCLPAISGEFPDRFGLWEAGREATGEDYGVPCDAAGTHRFSAELDRGRESSSTWRGWLGGRLVVWR